MYRSVALSCLFTTACASGATPVQPAQAAVAEPLGDRPKVEAPADSPATPPPPPSPTEDKTCTASLSPELQQALSSRAAKARHCYERLLRDDPTRAGAAVVAVRMSGQGQVERASLSKDEIGDPEFAQCILRNFREPVGTWIEGDCIDVNIPLRFVPKNPAPAGENPDPVPGSP